MSAVLLSLCLALGAAGSLHAQDGFPFINGSTFLEEPEPSVAVTVEPRRVAQRDRFTVSILIDHQDPTTLELTAPPVPDGLVQLAGPNVKPFIEQSRNRDSMVKILATYTYRVDQPGRKVLEPFRIAIGDRELMTEPILIEAGSRNAPAEVPFDVRWRIPEGQLYEGGTAALVLELVNLTEIGFPDAVRVSSPGSGVFEEVEGLGEIRFRTVGETTLYTVPVATYLYTATQRGEAVIPAARVTAFGMTVTGEQLRVPVKPVPADVRATGAVGTFRFDSWVDNPNVALGDSIVLHLRVRGTGNLSYLQVPAPRAEGMIVTEKSQNDSLRPTEFGYSGEREFVYRLLPEATGGFSIEVPRFSWFDPSTAATAWAEARRYAIQVAAAPESAGTEEDRTFPFPLLGQPEIERLQSIDLSGNPVSYLVFMPGPVALVLYLVFRKKGSGGKRRRLWAAGPAIVFLCAASASFPWELLERGAAEYEAGRFEEAAAAFGEASARAGGNAGIEYNLFVASYRAERYGEALRALRNAVRLKPMNQLFRQTLAWADRTLALDRQIPVSPRIHPDLLFLAAALAINLASFAAIMLLRGRRGISVILFVLLLFILVGAAGGLWYTIGQRSDTTGIVGPGPGSLRKIPRISSAEWFPLKAGAAVRIIAETGEFYLIETGYGIQGWISRENLFPE